MPTLSVKRLQVGSDNTILMDASKTTSPTHGMLRGIGLIKRIK